MDKTVPSYRIAIEFEINRWKGFRNSLENEEEKLAFDQIRDMQRSCFCRKRRMQPNNLRTHGYKHPHGSAEENAAARNRII
jgi:hypothetical protein